MADWNEMRRGGFVRTVLDYIRRTFLGRGGQPSEQGQGHSENERGKLMTYRVILEARDGHVETLGVFETRKAARVRIDQYRIDDEGHDEYWRLWIQDDDRIIYEHQSTNYIVDNLSAREKQLGRILSAEE